MKGYNILIKESIMDNLNNLVPYSRGIAAINLEINTDILTVWPKSILPMVDGELHDVIEEYTTEYTDSYGNKISTGVRTSNTIVAKWLCRDPNMMVPPNIRRGAEVQIYREANTDYFYWETVSNSKNYQKLETRIMGYSNTQNENEKPTPENTWTQGISTHEKKVNFVHTTKSDGEKWAYDVNVDVKQGLVNIMDDIGNLIKIDSGNGIIRLQTAQGAYIEINKRDITISCDNLTSNVSQVTQVNTMQMQNNATANIATVTPIQTHTGNLTVAGGISAGPGGDGSGFEMRGDIRHIGTMTTEGDHIIDGKSFNGHRHSETQSVTSPPI